MLVFKKRYLFLEKLYKTLNIVDGSHEFPVDLGIIWKIQVPIFMKKLIQGADWCRANATAC